MRRLAHVLLVSALVSGAGSAPFAHVHTHGQQVPRGTHHAAPQPAGHPAHGHAAHHQEHGTHWHLAGRTARDTAATPLLVGLRHRHAQVAVTAVAVEDPNLRGGTLTALPEVWKAPIVSHAPDRAVRIDAQARANPPPHGALAARPPPR